MAFFEISCNALDRQLAILNMAAAGAFPVDAAPPPRENPAKSGEAPLLRRLPIAIFRIAARGSLKQEVGKCL